MITQQDITKLKKVFATKVEMNARFDQVDQRFNKIDKNAEEQRDALAITLTDIIKLGDDTLNEIRLTKKELMQEINTVKAEQVKISHLVLIMYKTLTNHETRITGLEEKILLS